MKKLLSKIVCAVAVAAIAAYGVYTSPKETQVSNLTLANVEALARYELPEVTITCGETEGECWKPAELCMKGEITDYRCERTDDPMWYCTTLCW